ncbi:MAG: ABC transporter ATP-binding protein/permease [Chitinophagales bacterium]|nr:ABC transporter ATP-binding protein/permease [Chitinophagales bacterium]
MNTYFRLLAFSKPYSRYLPEYITIALLSVIFGTANFSLLIPLLNVLFGTVPPPSNISLPEFHFSIQYFIDVFNYWFHYVLDMKGKAGALAFVVIIILICVFLSNMFRYWSQRILSRMRSTLIQNIRRAVYEKFLVLHPGFFQKQKKGDLLSVISNDVQEVENSVVTTIQVIFRDPVTIVAYFILLFVISAKLTIFTLVLIPIGGFLIGSISKSLRKHSTTSQSLLGRILSIAEETIGGAKIIRGFNAENFLRKRFDDENDHARKISKSIQNLRELASPLSETIAVAIVACVMIYGGTLVLNENSSLTASQFIAYIALYSQILPPAKNIASAFASVQRGLAAGERILLITDAPIDIINSKNATTNSSFTKNIEYRNVSFGYENFPDEKKEGRMALNNINTIIEKGKVIALVGPSGSGKTTFADLLPRFYDPSQGSILIDGNDIRNYTLHDLRKLMGIVTQEPILFNDTVFNNIALGIPDAKEEDVMDAARVANAHDFISRMENGYQSIIGDRGNKLSGGEKQRLTIARAVLKNPPILILDEATSSLDTESERLVQEALYNLMKNRTSIVIAHRLSTIQNADEILVMRKGEIAERGTHAQLIASSGLYKRLVDLQMI